VAAAAGYACYYLNAQAGPSRAWLVQDDPAHAWAKDPALRTQFSPQE
jgi:5-deoxy-D-glucuronate isomerase